MAEDIFAKLRVNEVLQSYLEVSRPPVEIRDQLDIGYKIDGLSVFLFEIRPAWDFNTNTVSDTILELPYAKTTYVKSSGQWKIFWHRANGNWDVYKPEPVVATIEEWLDTVDEDSFGCFKG
jgi:Protein of unknown function (DUF3024)